MPVRQRSQRSPGEGYLCSPLTRERIRGRETALTIATQGVRTERLAEVIERNRARIPQKRGDAPGVATETKAKKKIPCILGLSQKIKGTVNKSTQIMD